MTLVCMSLLIFQEEAAMLQEFKERLGMEVRGFEWIGYFTKATHKHFVQFNGWDGYIYVKGAGKDSGLMSYTEYYKMTLEKELCIFVNGMIIGKSDYSDHYNTLHQVYIKRLNQKQGLKTETSYPVSNPNDYSVFESAVTLYRQGLFSLDQLRERVQRYIEQDEQETVLMAITKTA